MSYKDKGKQREANRRAQAKFKAKGITTKGITEQGITQPKVIPEDKTRLIPNFGQADCECMHCQVHRANKTRYTIINHGSYKSARQLAGNEVNRVSLPGDADYAGVAKVGIK